MRRKYLAILAAFPLANALSLANFQQITSISIPLACQLTYDTQIPTCTKADFQNGCSAACIAALQSVAQTVTDSCAGVTVSASTLLGIVENGGIVAALCPTLSTSTAHTTTKPASQSKTQATTVTIPTDSQGVTGGLGLKTTSTSVAAKTTSMTSSSVKSTRSSSVVSVTVTSSSTTTSTSIASTSESSTSDTSDTSTTSTTSTNEGKTSTTTSTTSSKKGSMETSSSSRSTATATANSGGNSDGSSGGGSPFDIQSSGSQIRGDSILGLVIIAMAYNLMGR